MNPIRKNEEGPTSSRSAHRYGRDLVCELDDLEDEPPTQDVFERRAWLRLTHHNWTNELALRWHLDPGFRKMKSRIQVVTNMLILETDPQTSQTSCGWPSLGKQIVRQAQPHLSRILYLYGGVTVRGAAAIMGSRSVPRHFSRVAAMSSDLAVPLAEPAHPPIRVVAFTVAFLGWFCAGFMMTITQLVGVPASIDLLDRTGQLDKVEYRELKARVADKSGSKVPLTTAEEQRFKGWKGLESQWFAWVQCAFLLGAATGGLVFGWVGDRLGRVKGMAFSILTYSVLSAATMFVQTPEQLVGCWFLACLGVGGTWPNGVALVSESWQSLSRPVAAGVLGTSANIGIFVLSTFAKEYPVTPDAWTWILCATAGVVPLGIFALLAVPESPRWLAAGASTAASVPRATIADVFRPQYLLTTLTGILLATVPVYGGWGVANWMVAWADGVNLDGSLKAAVVQARSFTGLIGSLLGGWVASVVGRRRSYFIISVVALGISQLTFQLLEPTDPTFLPWVAALGFFSGLYFGWLPLCLPELFPTRIRSTGAGVSFNFGRVLTAITVAAMATGTLKTYFGGDYAAIGRWTSLIFAVGMAAIVFAPDTSKNNLAD